MTHDANDTPQHPTPPADTRLLNLHELIATVRHTPYGTFAGDHGSRVDLRVQPAVKDTAAQICRANGTDLSSFLRACMMRLCEEYGATPHIARPVPPLASEE